LHADSIYESSSTIGGRSSNDADEQIEYQMQVQAARAKLEPDHFGRIGAEGRGLAMEEAIEYAVNMPAIETVRTMKPAEGLKEVDMFSRNVQEIIGTPRDVHGEGWKSRRLVLAGDGLPFSVHETTVAAGACLRFAYRAHSETVYCIEGRGTVEDVAAGMVHQLEPGTLYSVGIGDDHILKAETEIKFLCIFEPPLVGTEEAD
jgi:L-ectoine synthase